MRVEEEIEQGRVRKNERRGRVNEIMRKSEEERWEARVRKKERGGRVRKKGEED